MEGTSMIQRLQVKNYKSLKSLDSLELGRRNILVGPNMSGKSNLLDCFRFLREMCYSGANSAIMNRGGFSEVFWKGENGGPMSFRLNIEIEKTYDYELSIVGNPTDPNVPIFISREYLTVSSDGKVATLVDLSNGHGRIAHADGTSAFETPGPVRSALEFAVPGWEGTIVRNFISSWRFYNLIPSLMKQPYAAISQQALSENGQNFSSWFMTLQTSYPEEFRLMKQTACDVFPELGEILTPPTQFATTFMITQEKYLKRPITIGHMSDGEIVFLAWLSLIFAPSSLGAPLFCIEELENHLHPKLLETLVEVLNQRQKALGLHAAQIIATTHSPYLVDRVELDDLIVVEKINGATVCTRPASKKHLKDLLEREELGLGELWYSGALSGN